MSKNKETELDIFHYHEALDRCHVLGSQIDDVLLEHPVVRKHKKIRKKVDKAAFLLAEAYQMIGNVQHTNFDEITTKDK